MMRTYKAILPGGLGRKIKVKYQSATLPRDWKYWSMMALTLVWAVGLIFFLVRASNAPNVNEWWKNQSHQEEAKKTNAVNQLESKGFSSTDVAELKIQYTKVGDYFQLSFDTLSNFPSEKPKFVKAMTDPLAKHKTPVSKIPDNIQVLDGQKISVVGFMIPMTVQNNNTHTFILGQSRTTCCYGVVPNLNQWIYVTMGPGKEAEAIMDVPVTVFGTLQVGTKFDPQNAGWCLYRMTSEKVELPKRSWF
jgi:hypothetical protein